MTTLEEKAKHFAEQKKAARFRVISCSFAKKLISQFDTPENCLELIKWDEKKEMATYYDSGITLSVIDESDTVSLVMVDDKPIDTDYLYNRGYNTVYDLSSLAREIDNVRKHRKKNTPKLKKMYMLVKRLIGR